MAGRCFYIHIRYSSFPSLFISIGERHIRCSAAFLCLHILLVAFILKYRPSGFISSRRQQEIRDAGLNPADTFFTFSWLADLGLAALLYWLPALSSLVWLMEHLIAFAVPSSVVSSSGADEVNHCLGRNYLLGFGGNWFMHV